MNTSFLGGLLKGFGNIQAVQAQRAFQAEQADKAQRLSILQAAATNPNLDPSALPGLFEQMQEIYTPRGGSSKGKKSTPQAPRATQAPQAPQASQAPASQLPQPPQGFLSRLGSGIEHRLQAGLQGANQALGESQQPPPPPINFLTPEQQGTASAQKGIAEQQALFNYRQGVAQKTNLDPKSDAYSDFVLTGKLPTQFGEFRLGSHGLPMTLQAAIAQHPQAMSAPGVPMDWGSVPPGSYITFSLGTDGLFYASPVAPPQMSPNSILGQLDRAYQTISDPNATPQQKQAAVMTVQHYDPTRVRTNTTTHISTITKADGSTVQVAVPITSTSETSAPSPIANPARSNPNNPPTPPFAAKQISGTEGHKALPAIAQRGVTGAVEMIKLAGSIQQAIEQIVPNAAQRNSPMDRISGFDAALRYRTGFSSGALMDRINNLGAIMEIVGTTAIAQGRISNQQIEILKQHVPAASMTPALILSRAQLAQYVAKEVIQTLGGVYGITIDPQTGVETDQANPANPANPASHVNPTLKRSHPKAFQWLQSINPIPHGDGGD